MLLPFLALSFIGVVTTLVVVAKYHKQMTQTITPLRAVLIGFAASVFLVMLPIYWSHELTVVSSWLGKLLFTVFMSGVQTIRTFLAETDFETVKTCLESDAILRFLGDHGWGWVCGGCWIWFVVLSLISPLATAGFVLSFVSEITVQFRLWFLRGKNVYVFNELSERSLAIAHTVPDDDNAVFFFTDVFEENNEEYYELSREAEALRDVHLCKRDVVRLDKAIRKRSARRMPAKLQYFLVSEDESENVTHAIGLANFRTPNSNLTPQVYAVVTGEANKAILSSLNRMRADVNLEVSPHIKNPVECCSLKEFNEAADECAEQITQVMEFCVRCVHPMQRLAWKELCNAALHETARPVEGTDDKVISILLVGCGYHGMEFLKTALWMYQLPDCRLEINVVDTDKAMQDKVEGECPDIYLKSNLIATDDMQYTLRFFGGVDVMTQTFWKMLSDPKAACQKKDTNETAWELEDLERLSRTTAVFIGLGNDDANIKAALHLRMLFGRLEKNPAGEGRTAKEEAVRIYSVVYDAAKAENLKQSFRNHKSIPYNIEFIGSVTDMYNYKAVTYGEEERKSFKYHMHWAFVRSKFPDFEKAEFDAKRELDSYCRYDYLFLSSIAQKLHLDLFETPRYAAYFEQEEEKAGLRNKRGRVIEHRRWNAFMCAQGYIYGEKRDDRAKLHPYLVPQSDLDEIVQELDA